MTHLLVLATDTDAGKTTFCLLWLTAFSEHFEYWKPIESGPSDSQRVRELTGVVVHPCVKRLRDPLAPPLAAQREGVAMPTEADISAAAPQASRDRGLVIETFGSPFSPLTETELQIELIKSLVHRREQSDSFATVLVSSSTLGTIGRTIQCLDALSAQQIRPVVVLLGPHDEFAMTQIRRQRGVSVHHLHPPGQWDGAGLNSAALAQRPVLEAIRTEVCGPDSSAVSPQARGGMAERDRNSVWHPYTPLIDADPPLPCVAAQDEYLYLEDGRRLIDGISSWWTILHGHRYPPLMSALAEALRHFDHVHFAGVTHEPAVTLAELLLQTAPWQNGRVFYSDNGSTAVEVALKMAYQYWRHQGEPERNCFIGFQHGYHGDTFGAMAVSRDPIFFSHYEPLLFKAEIVPLDANYLAETLQRLKGRVAGVILEPLVQGAGGMQMHTPETLRQIVSIVHEHDVLFIADEVMTCGGRTGTLWAHQAAGVAPDLICAAKTLAGGILPLAVTLASPRIVAAFNTAERTRTFFHGHSFTAHPVACSVAVANWRLLTSTPDPNPARIEAFWRESVLPLKEHPRVRDVRIRGSIAAIEIAADGGYLANIGRELRHKCQDRNVLLRPLGNVLYALPPLQISADSLEQIAEAMKSCLE